MLHETTSIYNISRHNIEIILTMFIQLLNLKREIKQEEKMKEQLESKKDMNDFKIVIPMSDETIKKD